MSWSRVILVGITALTTVLVGGVAPARAGQQTTPPQTYLVQPEADQPADLIGQGYFTLTEAPGQSPTVRVAVKNPGAAPLRLLTYPVDAYQLEDSGIDFTTRGRELRGVGAWLTVDPPELTIPPGETARITAAVQVPPTLAAGQYVGGIAIENAEVQRQDGSSNVLIDLHYRQVIAAVITVPGPETVNLDVGAVQLLPSATGTRATVELTNHGAGVVKGTGRLEIGGSQGRVEPIPFTVGAILPASQAAISMEAPTLTLKPGAYDVRVTVTSPEERPLASWQGSVLLEASASQTTQASAPRELDPVRQVVPSAGSTGGLTVVLIVLVAGGLVVAVIAECAAMVALLVRRRQSRANYLRTRQAPDGDPR